MILDSLRARKHIFAALFAIALPAAALAAHWEADSAHSTIGFSVRHMMVSNVVGSFSKFTASIDGDPADPTTAQVKAEIDVNSVSTGNEKRDAHLRNADFFDAAKFPTITFVSKKVEKNGDKLAMTGDLTMHGVTKEVKLDLDGPTEAVHAMGSTRRGISATGKLSRKDFGVSFNKLLEGGGMVVGDEVKLNLELELVEKNGAPAGHASPNPAPSTASAEASPSPAAEK
jgi:polyisoprenoid-binding protein YceI